MNIYILYYQNLDKWDIIGCYFSADRAAEDLEHIERKYGKYYFIQKQEVK